MNDTRRILLVEDEEGLVTTLTDMLESEGYSVDVATNTSAAREKSYNNSYDLMMLDLMLPGGSGLDICRDVRQRGITTPILMLTAKRETWDKVIGLKIGADDYMTKPFETPELLARVEALLRRRTSVMNSANVMTCGDLILNRRKAEVTVNGEQVSLSPQEFRMLAHLMEHAGRLVTRDELLTDVWGYEQGTSTRTIDVYVSSVRHKIEDNPARPQRIVTVHGLGYKMIC